MSTVGRNTVTVHTVEHFGGGKISASGDVGSHIGPRDICSHNEHANPSHLDTGMTPFRKMQRTFQAKLQHEHG